ncbi:MAG TPA: SGNH/GDSL hydrolase family protein [Thermoanaerobaculia bacterium]
MQDPPSRPRFLALGDSYTIGEGVRPEESWPWQLALRLRDHGVPVGDPEIVARTGWTSEELYEEIRMRADIFSAHAPWDLVTILIGVNDQYRGLLPEDYRGWLAMILDEAVAFGSSAESVLVISIPDWSVTPFADQRDRDAIRAAIERFNEVNREEAETAGAGWLDITRLSRSAGEDLSLVGEDGLHPTGPMYRRWADLILPAALEILAKSGRGVAK